MRLEMGWHEQRSKRLRILSRAHHHHTENFSEYYKMEIDKYTEQTFRNVLPHTMIFIRPTRTSVDVKTHKQHTDSVDEALLCSHNIHDVIS